jgi:hypothetical protein
MNILVLTVTAPILDPAKQIKRFRETKPLTIREWLGQQYGPDFVEFDIPTFCTVNGVPVLRAEWDTYRFRDGDVISFISTVGDAVTIIIAIVAVIVAIAAYLLIPDPESPDTKEGDTVFSLRGQSNRMRLGEPIEVSYGRCRFFPSVAAPAYTRYIGNEAYQYSWLVIGQGEYEFEADKWAIDDTPLTDFDDIEMEVLPPGNLPTLFNSAVYQALEINNVELKAPNEDGFDGFSGPFTINAATTRITTVEVDIAFPQGLYETDGDGDRTSARVDYQFDVQRIDDDGAALTGWVTMLDSFKSLKTSTPQRFSLSFAVTEGRYQIRAKRTNNKDLDPGNVSSLYWEAAKGYAAITQDIGNLTSIAIKIKANGNINNNTKGRINGWGTRKLPIYNPGTGTWSALTATRNPVDAFCDMFRATYGAKLADEYLDLDGGLAELRERLNETEDWFDMTFDSNMGIWDAAKMVLKVGRAVPIPQGSLVTAVRDDPATLPAAIFNQTNIVKNSLSKQLQMYAFQEYDSVKIIYTDPQTWKPEEVLCKLPGVTVDRTESITLAGCTNRNKAYQFGMYLSARRKLQRRTVIFKTGLEGHIPTYMDLVTVAHDTVRVGFGGFVVDYDELTGEMILSDAVVFHPTLPHRVALRSVTGGILGEPIPVIAGSAPNRIILQDNPEEPLDFSPNQMPPLYVFGTALQLGFVGKVVSVTPADNNQVEIAVLNYDPGIYAYDGTTVPALDVTPYISNPPAPPVLSVALSAVAPFDGTGYASWPASPGAVAYRVQYSEDEGTTWGLIGEITTTGIPVPINIGPNHVQVAAISPNGRGLWTTSNRVFISVALEGAELTEDDQVTLTEDDKQTLDENAP